MGLFKNSGWALLKCEIFLISVSLVGSAFGALFKMYHFIAKDTYDPKHSSVYWIQLVLGVISGVVLSQVLYTTPPPERSWRIHSCCNSRCWRSPEGFPPRSYTVS